MIERSVLLDPAESVFGSHLEPQPRGRDGRIRSSG